jgi:hypothetical protein
MADDLDLSQLQLSRSTSPPALRKKLGHLPLAPAPAGLPQVIWKRPGDYRIFTYSLKKQVKTARIDELMLHVNDIHFADACVDVFVEIAKW